MIHTIKGIVGFDWDAGNIEKCTKHGVSRALIESLFMTTTPFIQPDVQHADEEDRFVAAGRVQGRNVFVVFTLRHKREGLLLRPISARFMHVKEARKYDQQEDSRS